MKNIKDIVIGICAIIGFTAILTGFTNEETSILQQYEFEIVTVVESVVPKGLGRSRMLAKTEIVDHSPSTSVRMEDGEKLNLKMISVRILEQKHLKKLNY